MYSVYLSTDSGVSVGELDFRLYGHAGYGVSILLKGVHIDVEQVSDDCEYVVFVDHQA